MKTKIAVILGTRPEIIKMGPVIKELHRRSEDYFVLHTGQHYSYNLDKVFFDQLNIPPARHNLNVGSGSHAEQTAKMLVGLEKVFLDEKPSIVLVQGDTNTVLAGALVAAKMHIKVGHVEAGLRSYDRNMPEEINRVLTDHCSDLLFAPTEGGASILLHEGIPESKVFVTGNTIVDAVIENRKTAAERSTILPELGLAPGKYLLVTAHRQENVDDRERFASILEGLQLVAKQLQIPLIYPIHPRAANRMEAFGLSAGDLRIIDPLDYLAFLQLEANASLILTDSGGIQEEACILGIPCVTLRENTERPETVGVGGNVLAGTDPATIVQCAKAMLNKSGWQNPFGDGRAGERIVDIVTRTVEAS